MADDFTTITAELPRDRWGRPLITPPEGGKPVAYTRVTTMAGAVDDTYHLSLWSQRMVALGMGRRTDLVLAASAITDPKDQSQKRTLNDIAKQAKDAAEGGARATIGTALHSFSERVDRGESLEGAPAAFLPDLAAYAEVMKPFTVVDIEGFCVQDDLRVGGTYDRILTLPDGGLTAPDGSTVTGNVIGDLKTGDNVELGMGKIAVQLGTYANSVNYNHADGSRSPLPGGVSTAWGIVIHLPAGSGRAALLWVDIAAGWEAARTIIPPVLAWRKRRGLSAPLATAAFSTGPALSLTEQVHAATSADGLRALYAANSSAWTAGLTALAQQRINELAAAS